MNRCDYGSFFELFANIFFITHSVYMYNTNRQTTYIGPSNFHPATQSKQQPSQQQQQQAGRERQSQTHADGENSAPLERRPARRTNPATVNSGPASNDTARPASYQGDYHVTSHARPRILLIRSNTDRTSQQVRRIYYTRVISSTCHLNTGHFESLEWNKTHMHMLNGAGQWELNL